MTNTVLGLFDTRREVENAIDELHASGYNAKDISIMIQDNQEGEELARSKGATIAQSAVSGVATGTVIGGIAGLLIGAGTLIIPGIGVFLVGGPLAAAFGLTGVSAITAEGALTGALAGGVVGALVELGRPEK